MELLCNELSFYPLSNGVREVEKKYLQLWNTFKIARKKFGFKKIIFQKDLINQQVTRELNYVQSIDLLKNKDLKRALITFLNPPYLDDLTDAESEEFFKSEYEIAVEDCPIKADPYGLPIAYIKGVPTISLDSHLFWRNKKINVRRINCESTKNLEFSVYNFCLESDIASPEIIEWADTSMIVDIVDKEILNNYLGFAKYEIVFWDTFFEQLMEWKSKNDKLYKYILALMKDVQIHPFAGGMGQTENLKGRGKEASKRITNTYPDGHRLSYSIENNVVTFIACKGHYEFH